MNVLDGITVVSLEQAVAAPFATRQLVALSITGPEEEPSKIGIFVTDCLALGGSEDVCPADITGSTGAPLPRTYLAPIA